MPQQTPSFLLPDGSAYAPGNAGTQFIQSDGQSFQPTAGQRLALPQTAPSVNAVAPYFKSLQTLVRPAVSAAVPALVTPGTAPAAGFMSKLSGLLGAGGKALGGAATAAGKDPLGVVNAGLGIAGAVEYATARAPELPGRPDPYAPTIRPAQGLNAAALAGGRSQIQAAQTQAGRATTSDSGTNATQKLFAQAQAGEQQNQLSLKDNEAFQQDQRRVDEQQNQAYQANYQTQRSYKEKVFDLGQRAYEARRQQGAAMSQAALTYFTQARADNINSAARAQESALYAKSGITPSWMRSSRATTGSTMRRTPGYTQDDEQTTPTLNANGGKIPGTRSTKFSAKYSGGGGHAAARDAFGEQMSHITAQAQQAFNQSLREASAKRSKGLRG